MGATVGPIWVGVPYTSIPMISIIGAAVTLRHCQRSRRSLSHFAVAGSTVLETVDELSKYYCRCRVPKSDRQRCLSHLISDENPSNGERWVESCDQVEEFHLTISAA